MAKHLAIVLLLIIALTISVSLNVFQFLNATNLESKLNELSFLKEPMVHLVDYDWKVVPVNWEFEYLQVNFTLFNSGYAPANLTLSIDALDSEGKSFMSEEMEISINGTSKLTFTDVRLQHDLMFDHNEICGVEFYCPYFFENSMGYEESIH